jgi:N-glycosylase/DNA lyase
MNNESFKRLKLSYIKKRDLIRARLKEFKDVLENEDDRRIFEELAFCIFAAGASAKMGIRSIDAVRDILFDAGAREISDRLQHVHRFPNSRARYIVYTRNHLEREFDFKLWGLIKSFKHPLDRRDFFARHKEIKGIGYKEASHFLRNIGFCGYGILDKHILRCLYELRLIRSPKPPATREKYLHIENKLKRLAALLKIDFDELDLLLWSERTGEILK